MPDPDSLPQLGGRQRGLHLKGNFTVPKSVLDLQRFERAWLTELGKVRDAKDRVGYLETAVEVLRRYPPGDSDEGWRFSRTWLRKAANYFVTQQVPPRENPNLARIARRVFQGLLTGVQSTLELWREAKESGTDAIEFLRGSPAAAGTLRELGHLALALKGAGVPPSPSGDLDELLEFSEALAERSRRTLASVTPWLRITREDLLSWVDTPDGSLQLPILIRRLIQETAADVERIHFPGGSGTSLVGWDGLVIARAIDPHVPEGTSGWELSVAKKSQKKAEEDYANRTQSPDGSPTADVTFVELICRPWVKAANFAADKTAQGRWREVRGYNVDDLEIWLERAPATSLWLAEMMGRPVDGLSTSEAWWGRWLSSTQPQLDESIVLAGREKVVDELRSRVSQSGITTIAGEVRLEEIKALVAATFRNDPSQPNAETIFIDDRNRARQLLQLPGNLIALLPSPDFLDGLPDSTDHHLLVAVPGSQHADVVVPPVADQTVAEKLEAAGLTNRKATDLGALARRSLLALRRELAVHKEIHIPTWTKGSDTLRRRALLLHTWNRSQPADTEIVSKFIGNNYAAIEDSLRVLAAASDDPMVSIVDERWHVVSPMDAWILLGPQLTIDDLEAFRSLVLKVLLDSDPFLDVPPERRWRASLDGISRRYSSDLRHGLARTLALMGSLDNLMIGGSQKISSIANSIVRELLTTANVDESPRTWLTVASLLPLIAEASPEVVLVSLKDALVPEGSLARAMFTDSERSGFGLPTSSPHTDFLWALETLAWSTEHFDSVVSVLATLAELDPGGDLANRPIESLKSLFLPWHPNTAASLDQRLSTLARLRERNPNVAWELMISMLPSAHGFQMVHRGPTYRDWKKAEPVVTTTEYRAVTEAVTRALLEDVGANSERWVSLIKELNDLPPSAREAIRERLLHVASEHLSEPDHLAIWQALRELISHHREYSDAKWALSSAELASLDTVADAFSPPSPLSRNRWLFKEGFVTLGDLKRRDDYRAYETELQKRRAAAIGEIVEEGGFERVLDLATETVSFYVGFSLASAFPSGEFDNQVFPHLSSAQATRVDLATSYFGRRFQDEGWPWLRSLIRTEAADSPAIAARLLGSTNDPRTAADQADELGNEVAEEYWSQLSYFGLGQDFPHVLEFSDRLIRVGRSAAALDLLSLYARQSEPDAEYAEAIASAFEALRDKPDDPELQRLNDFSLRTLLETLSKHRETIGVDRLIALEWFFLPMLGFEPHAPNLYRHLSEDPKFFADVLALIFRAENEDKETAPRPDEEKSRAENAYLLLSSWRLCPGIDEKGQIDSTKLRGWVTEARRLLSESGRKNIGDEQIGQALASAPKGEDGIWPAETIRDLLEELQNENVDHGLEIAIYNNRGVTSRALDEGGKQEWNIVEDYVQRARMMMEKWPRMAAIYRHLAESYEHQARREDAEAERRRRGLD